MAFATSAYRKVEPARLDQRAVVRHQVIVKRTTVRGHGRQPIEAELDDLSIYGCRLLVDGLFKNGERIWLRFEAGKPISGSAVWYEAGKLGCRFDEPIERELFRSLTLVFD
ncbi:MAG: PilZ domain-containing protein [Sphingorhabdus sp.]